MNPTTGAEYGTLRARIRFAWHPVRLDSGRWVWWTDYVATERLEPDYGGWTAGLWVVRHREAFDA